MDSTLTGQSRDNGNFQLAALLPRLVPVFIPLLWGNIGSAYNFGSHAKETRFHFLNVMGFLAQNYIKQSLLQ
ncbi:MAG: hypothetical protein J0651_02055, partial [Actinobacteria bacterium]|nr:hypothetical protein [Actinomycetota bacterium]